MALTYAHQCIECNGDYESEDKWAGFCPRCTHLIDAQNRGDVGRKARSYTSDMMRKGANRHAVKLLKDVKPKGAA